jgi:hypothetical protein
MIFRAQHSLPDYFFGIQVKARQAFNNFRIDYQWIDFFQLLLVLELLRSRELLCFLSSGTIFMLKPLS